MIYLDNGATSFHKPAAVRQAVLQALNKCANSGRGGYPEAIYAAQVVYNCRERAAQIFDCQPEQVIFTGNCTQGLNMAIRTLVKPGSRVVISGFEHNAVTRPLHLLGAQIIVAGRKLFDWNHMLEEWESALKKGVDAAIFSHVSNVFGYILPVQELAQLCRKNGVPFVIDAAQSAGMLPVKLNALGASFIAMPGHKGLLGPQGTGILLCGCLPAPFMAGGTGSESKNQQMPDYLPDRAEAGTLNVPGIAGLDAGLRYLQNAGMDKIFARECACAKQCVKDLQELGLRVFAGDHQGGTVSFIPKGDCEEMAEKLAGRGIAVRAGLHCAPLAHESAGTLDSGTVRVSFGHEATAVQNVAIRRIMAQIR